jgi:hypothetical protein
MTNARPQYPGARSGRLETGIQPLQNLSVNSAHLRAVLAQHPAVARGLSLVASQWKKFFANDLAVLHRVNADFGHFVTLFGFFV